MLLLVVTQDITYNQEFAFYVLHLTPALAMLVQVLDLPVLIILFVLLVQVILLPAKELVLLMVSLPTERIAYNVLLP